MENKAPKRILIVGAGFAGLTVARELERKLGRDPSGEAFGSSSDSARCRKHVIQ